MINFSAIDSTFLTRFAFALCFYWFWGILAKGIVEPLQSHLGKQFIFLTNKKAQELTRYADLTCSQLDDFFADQLAGGSDRLDRLINRHDLSPDDQLRFRQLVTERYQLAILLEKLGVENPAVDV